MSHLHAQFSIVFQSHEPCVRTHEISCYATTANHQMSARPNVSRPMSGNIGLSLASLQYCTYNLVIDSTYCFILPTFLTDFLTFCVFKIPLSEHFSYSIVFMTIYRCILKSPQIIYHLAHCYNTRSSQRQNWQLG